MNKSGTPAEIAKLAKNLLHPSRGLAFWKTPEPITTTISLLKETKDEEGNPDQDSLVVGKNYFRQLTFTFHKGRFAGKDKEVKTTIEELTRNGGVIDRFVAGTLTENEKNVVNAKAKAPVKRAPPPGYSAGPHINTSKLQPRLTANMLKPAAPAPTSNLSTVHVYNKPSNNAVYDPNAQGGRRRKTRRHRKSKKHTRKH